MLTKPSPKLKTLWYIVWVIWAVLGIAALLTLMILVDMIVFGICLGAWLLVIIAIAFWIPAAYREAEYSIDSKGAYMKWGVVWKKQVTVPYAKITNVDITRGVLERGLGIGTVHLQTAGAGGQQGQKAELKLPGIQDLDATKNLVLGQLKSAGPIEVPESSVQDILRDILDQVTAISSSLKNRK